MYGWQEKPINEKAELFQYQTELGQLKLILRFPRRVTRNVFETYKLEDYSGLYILLKEDENKVYIGQTKDLKSRLGEHEREDPSELEGWDLAIMLSDGRKNPYSLLSDEHLRKFLESYAITATKESEIKKCVNRVAEEPITPHFVAPILRYLKNEIEFVLSKLQVAEFFGEESPLLEPKIYPDELKYLLSQKGYTVNKLGEFEGEIEKEDNKFKVFIRPGSNKRRGWQITIREKVKNGILNSEGFLVVNRGGGYLIPSAKIGDWLSPEKIKETITTDIFVEVNEAKVWCSKKKEKMLDISEYTLKVSKETSLSS